jgi:hypothetical protein
MIRIDRTLYLVLAVALLSAFGSAMAQQAAPPPSGSWSGVLHNDKSARVQVIAELSARGASLHFEDPYGCRIDAGFIQNTGNGFYYVFQPSTNGGVFCDKLYPGGLLVRPANNGDLSVDLTNDTSRWSGTLRADSRSP